MFFSIRIHSTVKVVFSFCRTVHSVNSCRIRSAHGKLGSFWCRAHTVAFFRRVCLCKVLHIKTGWFTGNESKAKWQKLITSCCCRRCAAGTAYSPLRSVPAAPKQGVKRILWIEFRVRDQFSSGYFLVCYGYLLGFLYILAL